MSIHKLIPGSALLCSAFVLFLTIGCNTSTDNRPANATPNGNAAASPAASAASPSNSPVAKLNINTASETDFLRAIPDLGSRMVHEFEEYRPYKSIRQFRAEIGKYVDQNKIAEYERYIFVPIDENQSDAATLQQIPGLDTGEAEQLIAGRPYASRDAFLAKLGGNVSPEELAIARTYLVQR